MSDRRCPFCAVPLAQREVSSKYGATLVLDRCPSCRGIWCDRNELYQVTAKAAEGLSSADAAAGGGAAGTADVLRCPACREALMSLQGAGGLPGVERTLYCNGCGGFWLDERDLVAFCRRREERLAALGEEEKARLVQAARDAAAYDVFTDRSPGESPSERGGSAGDPAAAAALAGVALSAIAPPGVGPLVIAGLTLAERIAPFLADIMTQRLEATKEDGRALPKSPKQLGGPRNRR